MSESVATDVWFPGSTAEPPEDHDGEATPLPFYLTDHIRSFNTFGCYLAGQPWLSRAPHGDGHGVMVLPGLGAGDLSTFPLRRFLQRLGYQVSGWGLGLNVGPTAKVIHGLRDRVAAMANHTGGPVSLVGWSLGGIFARGLARHDESVVRQVVTLGSPIRMGHPRQARAIRMYQRFARLHMAPEQLPQPELAQIDPLPVPASSIYSRVDGIVDWRACLDRVDDSHENIAVWTSHLGFGHDPAVLWAVADRLAQPEENWEAFRAPWYARPLYPRPDAPING